MALVNIDSVLKELGRHMKTCPVGGGLEIMSYKRNRTVAVIKQSDGSFIIRETGYRHQDFKVESGGLVKKLKSIFKREFPRSRKLRLFKFQHEDQLQRIHQKI